MTKVHQLVRSCDACQGMKSLQTYNNNLSCLKMSIFELLSIDFPEPIPSYVDGRARYILSMSNTCLIGRLQRLTRMVLRTL